jgi:hypothetical protein
MAQPECPYSAAGGEEKESEIVSFAGQGSTSGEPLITFIFQYLAESAD